MQTVDADDASNSKTVYKVIGGDTDMFGVERQSGEIRTLAAIAKSKKKHFNLTVIAEDQDDPKLFSSINMKVYVEALQSSTYHHVNIPI